MNDRELLMHYGVKGMRWGVRKSRPSSSGSRRKLGTIQRMKRKSTLKKARKVKAAKAKAAKKRPLSEMSDEELRTKINRLQMEKTYAQLTAKQKSAGAKFIGDVLGQSAKNVATKYTTEAMIKLVDGMLKKK